MVHKQLKVLKFSAEWCQSCKLLEPIVKQLSSEYQQSNKPIVFITIDADNEETKNLYDEYKIATMPTLIICVEELDDNDVILSHKEISRINGVKPKKALKTLIDWNLASLLKS